MRIRLKVVFAAILLLVGAPVCFIAFAVLWVFDSTYNQGWSIGYFGDFNRTKAYLGSIEGVEINDDWYNHDITLEEFGFELSYKGDQIRLFFSEEDNARNMSKEDAIVELTRRLQEGDSPFYK
ncbi:MAG: hypothetical protein AAF434_04075 [Pseudomonadota bacterium]